MTIFHERPAWDETKGRLSPSVSTAAMRARSPQIAPTCRWTRVFAASCLGVYNKVPWASSCRVGLAFRPLTSRPSPSFHVTRPDGALAGFTPLGTIIRFAPPGHPAGRDVHEEPQPPGVGHRLLVGGFRHRRGPWRVALAYTGSSVALTFLITARSPSARCRLALRHQARPAPARQLR